MLLEGPRALTASQVYRVACAAMAELEARGFGAVFSPQFRIKLAQVDACRQQNGTPEDFEAVWSGVVPGTKTLQEKLDIELRYHIKKLESDFLASEGLSAPPEVSEEPGGIQERLRLLELENGQLRAALGDLGLDPENVKALHELHERIETLEAENEDLEFDVENLQRQVTTEREHSGDLEDDLERAKTCTEQAEAEAYAWEQEAKHRVEFSGREAMDLADWVLSLDVFQDVADIDMAMLKDLAQRLRATGRANVPGAGV